MSDRAEASACWPALPLLAAGAALWLLNHPYGGIWHDARVYTLMAVHWLSPAGFAGDPWFAGSGADGLSIFIPLHGLAIRLLGISDAAMFLTLAGAMAWLGVVYWLCRVWLGRDLAALVFLIVSATSITYCLGSPMLVLSESFVTSRLLAIPLSVAGLVAATRQRFRLGLGLQMLGMMLHPLMAVWGLLVTICLRLPDRAILLLVLAVAVLWGAAMANPLDLVAFHVMDREWQSLVKGTAVIVFHEAWPDLAINDALWWFAALLFAGRFGQSGLRRAYQLVALVCSAALLVSLITSYFLPLLLLVQLQLWRALWLAALFGLVAAFDIGWSAMRSGKIGLGLVLLLALSFIYRDEGGGLALFLAFCVWASYAEKIFSFAAASPARMLKITWGLAVLLAATALPDFLMDTWIVAHMERGQALALLENSLEWGVDLSRYTVLPLAVWWLLAKVGTKPRWRWSLLLGAAMLLLYAAAEWDRRPLHKRQTEARYRVGGDPEMFAGLVKPGQQVYWPGAPLRVWFDLGGASYVSSVQAIGIVFSRERMTEVRRRLERVALMDGLPRMEGNAAAVWRQLLRQEVKPLDLHTYEENSPPLTRAGLLALCRDPALDFVVSERDFPDWTAARHEEARGRNRVIYFLYDCGKLLPDRSVKATTSTLPLR